MTYLDRIRRLLDSEQGASMVEYAFLVILIAIVAVLAVQVVGNELSSSYSQAADAFP
jgi:Flp pilus assembly pilin Flp